MRQKWSRSLIAIAALAALPACERKPPPGADDQSSAVERAPQVGEPKLPSQLTEARKGGATPEQTDAGAAKEKPWEGPFLIITRSSAGVYRTRSFDRDQKIGYLRNGGKVAVYPEPIEADNCKGGWYRAVDGGFVCGSYGTTDASAPAARFATKQPVLDDVLPYTYARNAKNGTPLYKTVPTKEQMYFYEPYLPGAKAVQAAKAKKKAKASGSSKKAAKNGSHRKHSARRDGGTATAAVAGGDGGAPRSADGGKPETPWWQEENVEDRLHEISLEDLSAEADDILAKRMVKGFYIAVDKQFSWHGRPWYKSTKGLVVPADRFWVTKGSEFQGADLDGHDVSLPVAWVYGWHKTRPKYEIDPDQKKLKTSGSLDRFTFVDLTGKSVEIGGKEYLESTDGFWVRARYVRVTKPGPPPADLGPKERWLDINLSTQTLVAFEGTRAVYATLISSGKSNRDKEKDHRSPSGEFRIREKHVTTTMDGDGTAAGDLPYSIEDVPYVMYFHRSYAVHGAFWHRNYGTEMSHGCINLAPLDAKHLFFFTEPKIPTGWHGVWSSDEHPGSRVVIHE